LLKRRGRTCDETPRTRARSFARNKRKFGKHPLEHTRLGNCLSRRADESAFATSTLSSPAPFLFLTLLGTLSASPLRAELAWIAAPDTLKTKNFTFRQEFEVTEKAASALLRLAVTRSGSASLNGKVLGEAPAQFEVTDQIRVGKNILEIQAAESREVRPQAAAQWTIRLLNGSQHIIETDASWKVSASSAGATSEWTPIKIARKYSPSGDSLGLFRPTVTLPEQITLPPGFKAELLYRVPKLAQGSWGAMTVDGSRWPPRGGCRVRLPKPV
jgi:hypothetical protein